MNLKMNIVSVYFINKPSDYCLLKRLSRKTGVGNLAIAKPVIQLKALQRGSE